MRNRTAFSFSAKQTNARGARGILQKMASAARKKHARACAFAIVLIAAALFCTGCKGGLCIVHDWQQESILIPATCTSQGTTLERCANCGKTQERAIPEAEHVPQAQARHSTCQDEGYERTCCEECGEILYEKTYPALGHDWVRDTSDISQEAYICGICGARK